MEKIERWIYGFLFLLGGVFLLIYAGVDLFSKTDLYFLITTAIPVMLFGVLLILISTLLMSVNVRVKECVALIIFLIGILIVIISIARIITNSFIIYSEIISGIGVIYLGNSLFFHNEEKKKKEKRKLGIVLFIIGLIILLLYGFIIIQTIVPYNLEAVPYMLPFILLPFLIGITLLIYGKYSIKITHTTQERKNLAVFSIWMGFFILLLGNFSIMSKINYSYLLIIHTSYFPLDYLFIGIVLIIHGFFLQQAIRKRSLNVI